MALFVTSYPTLAVSAIYCIWNSYLRLRARHERCLRERVAYLLWVVAQQM